MSDSAETRVLILGGSAEASALCAALAAADGLAPILSLAGRTRTPVAQPIETRIGGFGGVDGLASYLRDHHIDVLVDATHPFAEQISVNAAAAAERVGCPLLVVGRPPWSPSPGDRWTEVATIEAAVAALGVCPRRVFLTIGRLRVAAFAAAPQHTYLLRSIDPVAPDCGLPLLETLEARGPFDADAEERLMRDKRIDVLVTKNSGGNGAYAKLEAARRIGLPVVLLARPASDAPAMDVPRAVANILSHRASVRRGV